MGSFILRYLPTNSYTHPATNKVSNITYAYVKSFNNAQSCTKSNAFCCPIIKSHTAADYVYSND